MVMKVLQWYLQALSCLIIPPLLSGLKIQDYERIEGLIRSWAPVVWLAPDEKYYPSSVSEFLEHVYPGGNNGEPAVAQEIPQGKKTEKLYLHTKVNLEKLKRMNNTFLHGKDPEKHVVPAYATFQTCYNNEVFGDQDLHFHVTYWFFFPYNQGKDVCFLGNIPTPLIFNTCLGKLKTFGNHVGDFEHLSMLFKNDYHPEEIYLSAHDFGVYYKYDPGTSMFRYGKQVRHAGFAQKPKFPPNLFVRRGRPVVFSAKGSHGLWASPGKHNYVRVPRLYDTNGFGSMWETWQDLHVFSVEGEVPGWMKFRGRWGNPKSNCLFLEKLGICEVSDGPVGLMQRQQDFHCDI